MKIKFVTADGCSKILDMPNDAPLYYKFPLLVPPTAKCHHPDEPVKMAVHGVRVYRRSHVKKSMAVYTEVISPI